MTRQLESEAQDIAAALGGTATPRPINGVLAYCLIDPPGGPPFFYGPPQSAAERGQQMALLQLAKLVIALRQKVEELETGVAGHDVVSRAFPEDRLHQP